MALINAQTGETVVGNLHILFTVDAWLMAEQMTGKGALELIRDATEMRFGFKEAQSLLWAGAEGYRRRHATGRKQVTLDEVSAVIEEVSLMGVLDALLDSITGSKALGMGADEQEVAASAAPFNGTGDASSSVPVPSIPSP